MNRIFKVVFFLIPGIVIVDLLIGRIITILFSGNDEMFWTVCFIIGLVQTFYILIKYLEGDFSK